jgi:putative copper export protein
MDIYVIVLRVLHIFAAVFWFGAAATFVLFIAPSVAATPEQAAALQVAQQRQTRLDNIGLVLLVIALSGMSTARYL